MLSRRIFMLAVVVCCALTLSSEARILFVCAGCEYTSIYFTSIDSAVREAQDFDTVFVRRGKYVCDGISLDKPITLVGRERDSVILVSSSGESPIITINSQNCVVKNMTLDVTRTKGFVGAGMLCSEVSANIENVNFLVNGVNDWPARV